MERDGKSDEKKAVTSIVPTFVFGVKNVVKRKKITAKKLKPTSLSRCRVCNKTSRDVTVTIRSDVMRVLPKDLSNIVVGYIHTVDAIILHKTQRQLHVSCVACYVTGPNSSAQKSNGRAGCQICSGILRFQKNPHTDYETTRDLLALFALPSPYSVYKWGPQRKLLN